MADSKEREAFEAGWYARHDAEHTLSAPRELDEAWQEYTAASGRDRRLPDCDCDQDGDYVGRIKS